MKKKEVEVEYGRVYKFSKNNGDFVIGILLSYDNNAYNILTIRNEKLTLPKGVKLNYVHVPTELKPIFKKVVDSYSEYYKKTFERHKLEEEGKAIEKQLGAIPYYSSVVPPMTKSYLCLIHYVAFEESGIKTGQIKRFYFTENIDEKDSANSVVGVVIEQSVDFYKVFTLENQCIKIPRSYIYTQTKLSGSDKARLSVISELLTKKMKVITRISELLKEGYEKQVPYEYYARELKNVCEGYKGEDFIVIKDLFDEDLDFHPKDFLDTFIANMSDKKREKLLQEHGFNLYLQTEKTDKGDIFTLRFDLKKEIATEIEFFDYKFLKKRADVGKFSAIEAVRQINYKKAQKISPLQPNVREYKWYVDKDDSHYEEELWACYIREGCHIDVKNGIGQYRPQGYYSIADSSGVFGWRYYLGEMIEDDAEFIVKGKSLYFHQWYKIRMDIEYLTEEVAIELSKYIKIR